MHADIFRRLLQRNLFVQMVFNIMDRPHDGSRIRLFQAFFDKFDKLNKIFSSNASTAFFEVISSIFCVNASLKENASSAPTPAWMAALAKKAMEPIMEFFAERNESFASTAFSPCAVIARNAFNAFLPSPFATALVSSSSSA